MRKPAIGISFKIYKNKKTDMETYLGELKKLCVGTIEADLFVFPSMGTLAVASDYLVNTEIHFGAQNIAPIANGALTGELSIESLIDWQADFVEVGHAERRQELGETDKCIAKKIKLALANQVTPVVCIGEDETQKKRLREQLNRQLRADLSDIPEEQLKKVILAYEPIWAIGQKEAASADYVHQAHRIIREEMIDLFSDEVAQAVRIIYGGSVSKENTEAIVKDENVDGVFVGRFGHDPQNFKEIVDLVLKIKNEVKE